MAWGGLYNGIGMVTWPPPCDPVVHFTDIYLNFDLNIIGLMMSKHGFDVWRHGSWGGVGIAGCAFVVSVLQVKKICCVRLGSRQDAAQFPASGGGGGFPKQCFVSVSV